MDILRLHDNIYDEIKRFVHKSELVTNLSVDLYADGTSLIVQILECSERITNLELVIKDDLSYNTVTEFCKRRFIKYVPINKVVKYFEGPTTIKHLHLNGKLDMMGDIISAANCNESIEQIDLTIMGESTSIPVSSKINKVTLENGKYNRIFTEFNCLLEKILVANPTIKELYVLDCSKNIRIVFDSDTIRIISDAVNQYRNLISLYISHCIINDKLDIAELSCLEKLHLVYPQSDSYTQIGHLVSQNGNLKSLIIEDYQVNSEEFLDIITLLAQNQTITSFYCDCVVVNVIELEKILVDNYTLVDFCVKSGYTKYRVENITYRNTMYLTNSRFMKTKVAP